MSIEPTVGHVFRFHVDPMPGFSGINECKVLEVEPSRRLTYTWTVMPKAPDAAPPPPMTVAWTLEPECDGTKGAITKRDFGTSTVPAGYAK